MTKTWFNMKAAGKGIGEIRIFADIGDFGITASDFVAQLEGLGDVSTLNIAISSNGGDVSQGFAIYNILNRHSARKVVRVEGLAASMASVIAMVGDEVVMPSNAMMMIHNPWGALMGEADQIKSFGDALATMQDNIADAYVARTGMDKTEVLDMMAAETWLSAKKAVELGFADSIENAMQISAAFDVSKFKHVPRRFADANLKRTEAMAKTPKKDDAQMESEDTADASTTKTAADIRAEMRAHDREVRSLCNLANMPKMADKFIDDELTISEVIVALDEAKAKAAAKPAKGGKASGELDAHNNGRGDNHKPAPEINMAAIYDRWNGRK